MNDPGGEIKKQKIIVAATTNEHKIAEVSAIAGLFGYMVVSRAEAKVPDIEIAETGTSFEENSFLKAKAVFDMLGGGMIVIADDSGIEVDALDGAPGVYSARFAGQEQPGKYMASSDGDAVDFEAADRDFEHMHRSRQDRASNAKLLRLLKGLPKEKRTARFVSVITCLRPGRETMVCRGEVEGYVGFEETGAEGFGYDPLFIPHGHERSFGLFTPEEKNAISHRGKALVMLAEKLAAE